MRVFLAALALAAAAAAARASGSGDGADAVVDRWMAAQGGRDRLGAVRNFEMCETIRFGSGDSVVNMRVAQTKDGHFRYETANPGSGLLVQAWDGMIGWQSNDRLGSGLIPQADLTGMILQHDLLPALILDRVYPKRRLAGEGEVDGRKCTVVGMTARDGVEERFYFDKATGQCLRDERPKASRPGQWTRADYSGFHPVGGLVLPDTITWVDQGFTLVIRRSGLVINPPLDEASFMISTAGLGEIAKIDAILSKNFAETGGDAIARIHSRVTHAILESPDGGMRIRKTILQKEPDLILNEYDTPGMGLRWEGFDGSVGWTSSEVGGFHLLKQPEAEALRRYGKLADEGRLGARFPLRRLAGARLVNGRATHAVILSGFQVQAGTFYFDDEDGRLLRLTSVFGDSDGHFEATQDFSDFRRIDGVEKPFVTTETDPTGKSVETIQSIENNAPLDDAAFRPRRGDW